jgi:hypothetical protein
MKLCFFYRRKLASLVDAGRKLGPGLQRHVNECAACRRFYQEDQAVARSLARGSGQERVAPTPFLQGRIIAAVKRVDQPAPTWLPWGRLAWTVGAAAGVVLIFNLVRAPVTPQPVITGPDLARVEREWGALQKRLPDEKKLQHWSGTVDQPLDKEMHALFHDARFAAITLVNNFLPDSLAKLPGDGSDR